MARGAKIRRAAHGAVKKTVALIEHPTTQRVVSGTNTVFTGAKLLAMLALGGLYLYSKLSKASAPAAGSGVPAPGTPVVTPLPAAASASASGSSALYAGADTASSQGFGRLGVLPRGAVGFAPQRR